MIEQLFGSKTRVKLLQLFMSSPNRSFYVREITRKIDEQINSVRRELANLLSIGIITSDTTNNKLYYEVNQEYEYFKPLRQIFGGTVSAEKPAKRTKSADATTPAGESPVAEAVVVDDEPQTELQRTVQKLGRVHYAVFTGVLTRDQNAPVDVLLVGEFNQNKVDKFIAGLESQEGRELRYAVISHKDFLYRKQIRDRFLYGVLDAKKQVIIDQEN